MSDNENEQPSDLNVEGEGEEQVPPEPKNILKPEQIAAGLSQVSKIHGKFLHTLNALKHCLNCQWVIYFYNDRETIKVIYL